MTGSRLSTVTRATPTTDVAVLGGGPAGTTAARMLAHLGHRVVLLTRPAPGPPLAESLTPSCAKLLARIGVLEAVNRAGFVRSTGHTVRWGSGTARVEPFADGELGWQLSSADLERVLLKEAKAAGALVHRHASVRAVMVNDDGAASRVSYEERGRIRQIEAPWVIDCTGRTGLMSRSGSGRLAAGARTIAIVGTWERRPHWKLADETHTHVESYPGGWAWSVPLSRTRRQVTVMLDPTRTDVARGSRLRLTYREELARTAMIRGMIEGARFLGSPWARDASSYESAAPAYRRVLVAGDAASFVDPLSSYGVKKAMASAWLAATVVHSVLRDASIEEAALALFAVRERAMMSGLKRQLAELAREAAEAHAEAHAEARPQLHPAGFWGDRAGADIVDAGGDPDVAALRADDDVRAAFEEIRSRPTIEFRAVSNVRRGPRPVVLGDRVVLADHLIVPAFPEGIRYIRSVDLMRLADLAPAQREVPALFDAYNKTGTPAAIEDFLGALAVLVGKGILEFSA